MLNLAERWRSAAPCVSAARLQRFCGDRGGRIGLGKGGALLVKTIRLESLDEGEEVFVRDGGSGGRGALSWQRRSLVFNTRTLQVNNNIKALNLTETSCVDVSGHVFVYIPLKPGTA